MIEDFACKETETVWNGQRSRKFLPDIQETARRKLRYLHFAKDVMDCAALRATGWKR